MLSIHINNILQTAASSSGTAHLLISGQIDTEGLTEEERGQFVMWYLSYFRTLEQAYHHYLAGNFKQSIWEGHARHTQALLHSPGIARYWEVRKDVFSPEFRDYIDNLASGEPSVISGHAAMDKLRVGD